VSTKIQIFKVGDPADQSSMLRFKISAAARF